MTILILDANDQATSALDDGIRVRGYAVSRVGSYEAAAAGCRAQTVDLCIVCESSSVPTTLAPVSSLLESNPQLHVLLLSAKVPDELACHPRVRVLDDEADLAGTLQEVSSRMIAKHLTSSKPAGMESFGDARGQYAASLEARVAAVGEALRSAQTGAAPLDLARYLAHRIYGSAAAFGFAHVGQVAGELEERILETFERGQVHDVDWRNFRAVLQRLNEAAGLPSKGSLAGAAMSLPPKPDVLAGGVHVLLVDDDGDFVAEVTALCTELGASLSVVSTTRELTAKVDMLKPDLVLMNALMPGVSGFDACRALKASIFHRQLPVLLATQRLSSGTETRAFQAGADDVVHKPAYAKELRARLGVRVELIRLRANQARAEARAFMVAAPQAAGKGTGANLGQEGA